MNIYFYAAEYTEERNDRRFEAILSVLKRADVHLSSNIGERVDLGGERQSDIESRGGTLLEVMQAIVLEATKPDAQIGYLLAFALTQKKPLLLLVEKGSRPPFLDSPTLKKLPKHIVIEWYTIDSLHTILGRFLGSIVKVAVKESPEIKFTLRLTRTEERYLEYRSHGSKKSKADFLRALLEKNMEGDARFQKWLKKRQG